MSDNTETNEPTETIKIPENGNFDGDASQENNFSEEPDVDGLELKVAQLAEENIALQAQVAELTKQLEAASKKAAAKAGPKTVKARKLGVMKGEAYSAPELKEMIDAASAVEIIVSDGKVEQPGIAPVCVSGDAWRVSDRLKLVAGMVTIEATQHVTHAGYALVVDGEQVAWGPRPDVLSLPAGRKMEITDDVIF